MEAKEVNDIYTTDFGFQYRRDWIIKYGKDPSTNEKFTGHYTKNTDGTERNDPMKSDTTLPNGADAMSWADNIRFPSHYGLSYVNGDDTLQENDSLKTFYGQYKDTYGWDGNDPVTISDWEWMFRIFEEPIGQIRKAGKGGKDSDSYCLSIYNPGYIANGDLVCAFGGGGPCWYRDGDVAKFGVTDEDEGFRTYLQTMNKWYDKTWLDNTFASNTDVFYQIDLNTGIMQGKVGLWMGSQATFGNGIYNEKQTNTHGAVVSGASQPINDVYGNDSVKYAIPYTMYGGTTTLGSSIVVSANAAETKDMKLLLGYIDFFYGEEGSVMKQLGLSKEQYEESQDPLYKKYGLTNGAYTVTEDSDGSKTYQYVKALEENNGEIRSAMTGTLLIGLAANEDIFYDYPELRVNSLQQWRLYPNIGFFDGAFNTLRSTELVIKYEAARVAVETEYMYVQVPKLIKGERDPYNNSDWNGFVSACRNRGCDDILDDYTALIKMINKL